MLADAIILFDGVCNLCNNSVQFVIDRDTDNKFKFASIQSETGRRLIKFHNVPFIENDTFILIQDGRVYTRSTAALKVARSLKGPVKLLYGFILVPPFIRNAVYNFIASNRYKWFGKRDTCMMPTKDLIEKFIN